MTMQDPIADMITRIRNAQRAHHLDVSMPSSKLKRSLAELFKNEGYIEGMEVSEGPKPVLTIQLKYHKGKPVFDLLKKVSRPGLRIYRTCEDLPKVMDGFGVAVISTSKGIMTDRQAREQGLGGEVLLLVA